MATISSLTEAREIAARTFATAPEWVLGVQVEMTFGTVEVDREGVVRLADEAPLWAAAEKLAVC